MKKTALILALVACLVLSVFAAVACEQDPETVQHTVTFKLGDETIATKTVDDNGVVSPLPTLANDKIPENKVFDGWFVGDTQFTAETKVTSDLTVVAKLSDKQNTEPIDDDNLYTITLVLNGETYETIANQKANSKINLLSYSSYDYEVNEWVDENNVKYAGTGSYTVKGNATLTAVNPKPIQFTMAKALDGDYFTVTGLLLFDTSLQELTIPETFLGLPVKKIADEAFGNVYNATVTSLTVPDSVEYIGENAFGALSALEELSVPHLGAESYASLKSEYTSYPNEKALFAYWFSTDLNDISAIPESAINQYAYIGGMYNVNSKESLLASDIGYYGAFIPTSLQDVTVRGGVIFSYAFTNVYTVENFNIGDDVTEIGLWAFSLAGLYSDDTDYPCANRKINISENSKLNYIGMQAFEDNYTLKSFYLPKNVEEVRFSTFNGCIALESFTFAQDSQLKLINERAFMFCEKLDNVQLPNSLATIANSAFYGCGLTGITIPASVVNMATGVFYDCQNLEEAVFATGSELTEIPGGTFALCSKLASLTLPAGIISIGDRAFYSCKLIDEFDFSKIESIGLMAFADTGLIEAEFNPCLKTLGLGAFEYCEDLVSVEFTGTGYAASLQLTDSCFAESGSLNTFVFPDSATIIPDRCFIGSGLNTIEISNTVKTIGVMAFARCPNLQTVSFEANSTLETIKANAFRSSSNLASADLPASLKTIEIAAFIDCNALVATISVTINTIESSAFARTKSITVSCSHMGAIPVGWAGDWDNGATVSYTAGRQITTFADNYLFLEGYDMSNERRAYVTAFHDTYEDDDDREVTYNGDPLVLPESLYFVNGNYPATYLAGAFKNARTITKVTLPASMTFIPNQFFMGCTNLTEVVIPEGSQLTGVGAEAFSGCTKLEKVTFPSTFKPTMIGKNAFYNCTKLADMTIDLSEVQSIYEGAFNNCQLWEQEITLSDNLVNLGVNAFRSCNKLTVNLAEEFAIAEIPEGAFSGVIMGDYSFANVTSIGDRAFAGSSISGKLVIPANVKTIGSYAFYNCSDLTFVTIEDGVEKIGDYAFSSCGDLQYVVIKGTNLNVGMRPFQYSYSIEGIFLESIKIVYEEKPWGAVVPQAPSGWDYEWYYLTDEREFDFYDAGTWSYVDGVPTPNEPAED